MNINYKELLSLRYNRKLIPNEVYFTNKGIFRAIDKSSYTEYIITTNNITGLTKNSVGLSNVDNTSDVNKPISDPTLLYLSGNYYPLSNPAGYISSVSPSTILAALGYTPVNIAGDTMTGNLILNADPTNALGAVTKQYVDNVVTGLNFHEPVHAATTGNLSATYLNGTLGVGATLTAISNGALIVDGHTMLTGERLMVWQQTSAFENGIYDVTNTGDSSNPFILTRSADADNSPTGELAYGDFCFVQQGTLYGGYGFIMNTPGIITIGTTNISYVQFNAAQVITAGYGLQELTPNILSVDTSVIATLSSLSGYLTTAAAALTYQPIGSYLTTISGLNVSLLTNDSGYITSSALTPYLTSATAATTYFPIPTGTTSEYLRGDGSAATFPTIPTITPSALTEVDDTNITISLGGTPGTALLQPVTITAGWTGTLADARIASAATWNNKSRLQYNNSTGTQSITAATVTYITGSAITTANIQAGTVVTWDISVTKTAAGTAAPVWTVRFGTTSSTSDSTLLTFTGAAQTAAADTGMITIKCVFRTVGSGTSAVLAGHYSLVHQLDQTGLSTGGGGAYVASSGFNSTTASAFLGVTVNSGASAVWTVNQVMTKIENII